jgi:hypothetical protein
MLRSASVNNVALQISRSISQIVNDLPLIALEWPHPATRIGLASLLMATSPARTHRGASSAGQVAPKASKGRHYIFDRTALLDGMQSRNGTRSPLSSHAASHSAYR